VAILRHELWDEGDGRRTFCLAGPMGADARALLEPGARLVWEFEAGSHFEAMSLYYEHMGWGSYAEHDWDHQPYPDDWRLRQGRDG
jgi:hypothetical protein